MQANEVRNDEVYAVRVSGVEERVRIVSAHAEGGWLGRIERTGRPLRIRNARKLRPTE